MSKSKVRKIVIMGIGCILFLLGSVWFSNTFNNSRLVEKMDYSTYVFSVKDVPMIAAILLVVACFLYIAFLWTILMIKKMRSKPAYTSALNPKLGLLGFLGFFGLLGIESYSNNQGIFPFVFFVFFGFFGFYFEGKMSNILIDERFQENRNKALLKAFKIGFGLLFIIILLVGRGLSADNLEFCAAFLIASISIIYAITIFLSEYFLYQYDHDKQSEE